ncbi:aminotransferase class IV [bacterium]|nr:aminotransferase class IV [bacterium]
MDIYYIDGKFVRADEAVISVNDMIVLRGFGVFDFLKTYNRKPFHLDDHIKRLQKSAELIELKMPCSHKEISDIVYQTIEKNDHAEYNIRLVITGGISHDSMTPEGNSKLMVMVTAAHKIPDEWYTKGVKIVTSPVERCMPGAKSTTYMSAVLALRKARSKGAVESIYVDSEDHLLEGTTTNLYLIDGNKLITAPEDNILPGITRKVLLEILKDDFEIEVRNVNKSEIGTIQEAFLSASNKEIVPVIQIDNVILNGGKIGEGVKKVMAIFRKHTDDFANS